MHLPGNVRGKLINDLLHWKPRHFLVMSWRPPVAAPETMHRARADTYDPYLGIGQVIAEFVTRRQLIGIDLVYASVNVQGYVLAIVVGRQIRQDGTFIQGVPSMCKFLFAVAALGRCHVFPAKGHGIS